MVAKVPYNHRIRSLYFADIAHLVWHPLRLAVVLVKVGRLIPIAAVLILVLSAVAYVSRYHPAEEPFASIDVVALQRMAIPGALSRAHRFLEHDCSACHTRIKGPDATSCITCHADNEPLLNTQSTAFHASIKSCGGCHVEHQGLDARPMLMDHTVLVKIAKAADTSSQEPTMGLGRFSFIPILQSRRWFASAVTPIRIRIGPSLARSALIATRRSHGA